jgi:ketosteroid isomerase-like protein
VDKLAPAAHHDRRASKEGGHQTHPNKEILRKSDEAMEAGDIEGFFSYFADDVVVHATGQSALAGTYKGKDQFQELFGRFMDAVGDYTFETHAYLADDEHGITMQKARAVKYGATLEFDEIFVMHFRDGKISEMWYVPTDQARFDAWIAS